IRANVAASMPGPRSRTAIAQPSACAAIPSAAGSTAAGMRRCGGVFPRARIGYRRGALVAPGVRRGATELA
ncbi:MAG: hypothetical protein RIT45_1900, partial [Pseudomonadota bacterium]